MTRFEFQKTMEITPPPMSDSVTRFLEWAYETLDIDYSVDIGQLQDILNEADSLDLCAHRIAPFKVRRWLKAMEKEHGCVVVIDKDQVLF